MERAEFTSQIRREQLSTGEDVDVASPMEIEGGQRCRISNRCWLDSRVKKEKARK